MTPRMPTPALVRHCVIEAGIAFAVAVAFHYAVVGADPRVRITAAAVVGWAWGRFCGYYAIRHCRDSLWDAVALSGAGLTAYVVPLVYL
jgi:hypothetical protein